MEQNMFAAKRAVLPGNNLVFTGAGNSLSLLGRLARQENVGKEKPGNVKPGAGRGMKTIDALFGKILADPEKMHKCAKDTMERAESLLKEVNYTPADLEIFSLEKFEELAREHAYDFYGRAGSICTVLMNRSPEAAFRIHTSHLPGKIYDLAIDCEGKRVHVVGHAGHTAGAGMVGGELVIDGDAGVNLGLMSETVIRLGGRVLSDDPPYPGRSDVWIGGRLVIKNGKCLFEWSYARKEFTKQPARND